MVASDFDNQNQFQEASHFQLRDLTAIINTTDDGILHKYTGMSAECLTQLNYFYL